MSRLAPLPIGKEKFPDHSLVELRGTGGFAEVWEAVRADGTHVALKFLSGYEGRSAPKEIKAIQALRQLPNPHLIETYQVTLWQGYLVVSMELADGSLADLAEAYDMEFGQLMDQAKVCSYLTQAAAGLDFLNHGKHQFDGQTMSIQHCDIKPGNLLLCGSVVKLSDYGLATGLHGGQFAHRKAGTPNYAAPEIFQGNLSPWSDQYSLAVTYCYLRGGRLPFESVDSFKASWPRQRGPADLSMLTMSERYVIGRALSLIPQERWPSCTEMMRQLARSAV